MIAELLFKCGAYGGDISNPGRHSPRGLMEHATIYEQIVKPYLIQIHACPAGQYPLPNIDNISIPVDWKNKIDTILSMGGYDGLRPWAYKSSKLALLWPLWVYAYPDAKWVVVRRRTGDIIQSCVQTKYMQAFKIQRNRDAVGTNTEEEAWKWWVHWYEARFVEMIEAGINIKIVWPDRIVNGDYRQIYETVEWCGLKWDSDALSFIDPKFWKARRGDD